jgi:hypothetical protein
VSDFAQARFLTLNYIKRCRYFIAYDLQVGPKAIESAGEIALPGRLFEGAAGGAVMIGTEPRCPEFRELFDWPDALIEIPVEPDDIRAVLADLDAKPERLARIRATNAVESLRRHDWAYRWKTVLETLGFPPTEGVKARIAKLDALAAIGEGSIHKGRLRATAGV